MKRATLALLLGGSLWACGNGGTLTLVTPNVSYPARTVEVQVSGAGTMFSPNTTVELGDPAITAKDLGVGSDGNLRVTLNIGASARQCFQNGPRGFEVRIPCRDEWHKGSTALRLQFGETRRDPAHSFAPKASATENTSLSPRPDRQRTMD